MNANLGDVFLLFLIIACIGSSSAHQAQNKEKPLNPRAKCSTDYSPYCTCDDYGYGRILSCNIYSTQDFEGLRNILSTNSYSDYYQVSLYMKGTLNIPQDVLGGKRTKYLNFYCPLPLSTPLGEIDADAFKSTSDYTDTLYIQYCDLRNRSFAFLSQFPVLTHLSIWDSALQKMSDMPYLPELTALYLELTTDFESWHSPSLTPNLMEIKLNQMSDLDDQRIDSILSSMTDSFTYKKLNYLSISANKLTNVPPLVFTFPALKNLLLLYNPIKTLTQGSIDASLINLDFLHLERMQLETIENGAFVGNFSETEIYLGNNQLTSFPSSVFRVLLRTMVNRSGYVDIDQNPIVDDCGLAWLLVDNRILLRNVKNGAIANGTRFEDLDPSEYYNC